MDSYGENAVLPVALLLRPEGKEYPAEDEFQRRLERRHAAAIGADFKKAAFGRPIVVENEDGSHEVIDGYHRVVGAHIAGEQEVPVVLQRRSAKSDSADLFVTVNRDRRSVSPNERFHAECVAGDAMMLSLDGLLLEYGLDARLLDREGTIPFRPINPAILWFRENQRALVAGLLMLRRYVDVPGQKPWFGDSRTLAVLSSFAATEEEPTVEEFNAMAERLWPHIDALVDWIKAKTKNVPQSYKVTNRLLLRELRKERKVLAAA